MAATHYPQRRYPPELRQRAVRLVFETIEAEGRSFGVITRIARQLDIGSESLRLWVRQAEVDRGERAGLTTDERARIAELRAREPGAAPRQRDPEGGLGFLRAGARPRPPR